LALFDRLKYDPVNDSELVWKYPSDQITLGSQLLVNTSQEAIFRKNGKNVDIFEPGNHTLSTSNLPVLSTIINLPFGGQTPFSAEVWFVNKTPKRDLKWGTSSPIPLIDPKYNMPVNIRAFGQWGIEITDAILFVDQMVGAKSLAESDQIYEYFRGELIQDVSEIISQDIASGVASIFNINAALSSISKRVSEIFNARLRKYGINLTNFSLDRINLPQEEMQKIQEIMLKRMEVEQLGSVNVTNEYATVKTFDILNNAANNQSGGVMPIIAQMGMGNALANTASEKMSGQSDANNLESKLKKLKGLLDSGLITQEDYEKKKTKFLEDF
jgi:membrane protease subunit (stomatin/prohibitin family)